MFLTISFAAIAIVAIVVALYQAQQNIESENEARNLRTFNYNLRDELKRERDKNLTLSAAPVVPVEYTVGAATAVQTIAKTPAPRKSRAKPKPVVAITPPADSTE